MSGTFFLTSLLIIVSLASVNGLKCHEGINASIGGLPMYQWNVRECFDESRCFSQKLQIPLVKANNILLTMEYGGCISNAYDSLITCENMFGENSDFNPALLLDMITKTEDIFLDMETEFNKNVRDHLNMLFSSGNDTKEFVDGAITFAENLGFNMDKMKEIEPSFIKLLQSVLSTTDRSNLEKAIDELFSAIGKLDTKNLKNSENLYKFLLNFVRPSYIEHIKISSDKVLIENSPGLIKSTLPASWNANQWYDVIIEILGDIDNQHLRQSITEVIKTIKSASKIPEKYNKFLDPILNTLPDLSEQIANGNISYAVTWSLKVLEAESTRNNATDKLATAFINDMKASFPGVKIPLPVRTMITWLPGLFYQFFPADKKEIDRVYLELDKMFYLPDNPPVTVHNKMGKFLLRIVDLSPPKNEEQYKITQLAMLTTSRSLYEILNSHTKELDIIFDTLSKSFETYPKMDTGKMVINLVTNLGGTVPTEIKPLLKTAQSIVEAAGKADVGNNVYTALSNVITEYKITYPKSEFPDLFQRAIDLVKNTSTIAPLNCEYNDYNSGSTEYRDCIDIYIEALHEKTRNNIQLGIDLSVDVLFALFHVLDDSVEPVNPVPVVEPYLDLFRVLDPEDVKQLFKDYISWVEKINENAPQYLSFDAFVHTFNKTVHIITSKMGDAIKGLRDFHRPDSCKYTSCGAELCNSHQLIQKAIPFTKPVQVKMQKNPKKIPVAPAGGSEKMLPSLWMLCITMLAMMGI